MGEPVNILRVGVIGAGMISSQYSDTLARTPGLDVIAVADLEPDRATALAARHPGARVCDADELVGADDVDLVLNLTLPTEHASITLAALAAGKHVYTEKPLAATVAQGHQVVAASTAAGLRVGCAPDTVLGTGIQTARALVDAGRIGSPVAATAFMTTPGHERWHADPEFYYRPGGGPLYDMGPYYLSALVHLLGPVARVSAVSSRPRGRRTIGAGPRAGESFEVEVDTHVTGALIHASGAVSTVLMSFDVWAARLPAIEVHGSAGSLSVPDPNRFDGPVEVYEPQAAGWQRARRSAGYVGAGRGVGITDLAAALTTGGPHRACAGLALHVLDVMETLTRSAQEGRALDITTPTARPEAVPGLWSAEGTDRD